MSEPVVECVPNFSEGRDPAVIEQIVGAIRASGGVRVLDVDPGADTHRTVVTFVGGPEAVVAAAFAGVATAAELIDMNAHTGAHPRMGATDVCPFIPVEGITIEECADLARSLGERVGSELGIPVYLYEAAASRPERRNLAVVRKGEYEGLADKLADPAWAPDYGPSSPHPRAGALITGAREFLIAYNISLNTRDAKLATDIAFDLREKGRVARTPNPSPIYMRGEILFHEAGRLRCGSCDHTTPDAAALAAHTAAEHGYELAALLAANDVPPGDLVGRKVYRPGRFAHCKAIGWKVDAYDRAQISLNLTDHQVTPPHLVLEAARELAAQRGVVVTGSEIVGLVPFEALRQAGEYYLRRQGRTPGVPVGDLLATAVQSMGLTDVAPFDPATKVLGLPPAPGPLASLGVADFVDEASRDTPAPGGGSLAALAGALGAALASMVASLSGDAAMAEVAVEAQAVKDRLVAAVDADTDAFNDYLIARRLPAGTDAEKQARAAAMQAGLRHVIDVPLATADASLAALKLADRVAREGLAASVTDGAVGVQLALAGVRGGVWNALVNLADLTDADWARGVRDRCDALMAEAGRLAEANAAFVAERLS